MRPASILLLLLLALIAALGWFVAKGERAEVEPAEPEVAHVVEALPAATATNRVERVELAPELSEETERAPEIAPKAPGPCRVRVIDALSSLPVAGASVFLLRESPVERMFELSKDLVASEDSRGDRRLGVTDSDGGLDVAERESGEWFWASEGERSGAVRRPVEAPECTLVLQRPEMLEFEVRDSAGNLAAGARLLELGTLSDFVTDGAGRVTIPMVAFPAAGNAAALEFLLPLVDTTPRRHKVRVGARPRSPLKFTLGPSGTLELLATGNGRPLALEGLSIRWGCLVPDGDGIERTWFWDEATTTGSVLVPHVGVGRELWGRAFHPSLVFPRTELPGLERAGELAVRTIALEHGRVRFRGTAVDSDGTPLPTLHLAVTTRGSLGGEPQPAPFRFTGPTDATGAFDFVENWRDGEEHRDWEPGPTFEFQAFSEEFDSWAAEVTTPTWSLDLGLARARTLEFGTVVFRRVASRPESR